MFRNNMGWIIEIIGGIISGGLEQLVATLVRSTKLLYAGPGSTGMGDRFGKFISV